MNINELYPSKYLRAEDAPEGQDLTLTMNKVVVETLGQGDQAENKPIVYFEETDQGLALNKTNATTIAMLYGPDTDGWKGKKIRLFSTEVEFRGKMTLALRIRTRKPQASNGNAKPQPVAVAAKSDDEEIWEE